MAWMRSRPKLVLVSLANLGLVAGLLSCSTVERTVMAPPDIPGATFIGSKECAQCHEDTVKDFAHATHSRLKAAGDNAVNIGCETCHGPGSVHSQSGGAARTIVNPRKSPDACFQCHLDKKAEFNLPHRHPVAEGKVSCGDCHDPHKGDAIQGGVKSLATETDTCGKCHTAQRGPFVFEHEAVREGCTACHSPHGSVNAKLLQQRNASLCLKCHFQSHSSAEIAAGRMDIGGRNHAGSLNTGTCWTAGCHEAVHGSQIGSSIRY